MRAQRALAGRCEPQGSREEMPSLAQCAHATNSPEKEDPLQAFLNAHCELHSQAWCRSAELWRAYQQWVEQHQERYPLARGAFIAQLKAHGCRAERTMSARIWRGIALVKKEA